jgi:type IV secretory pathway protease TraF
MPLGIYREVPAMVERGALVAICLPESVARLGRERRYLPAGRCPGDAGQVVKQIAAVPGDRVVLGPSPLCQRE